MLPLSRPVSFDDHIRRTAPDTDVTLLLYGDYQSPECAQAHITVKEIFEHYEKRVLFVFRHFPLTALHPQAERAAQAAEAAGREGKFWDMHDTLFEQERVDDGSLIAYARALDLNTDQFSEAIDLGLYKPRVERDIESAIESGVSTAPTFFVNGVRHDGGYSYHALTRAFERAMSMASVRA
jgi:protein-disulfide isomerase